MDEYLGQVVDLENSRTISGQKYTLESVIIVQNITLETLNGELIDFPSLLTVSTNQTITGDFEMQRMNASFIEVHRINGQNLTDYIRTSGTDEVQFVTGVVDMENIDVRGTLSLENHVLNGCNLTRYLDVTEFDHLDSLVIADGSLTLEEPFQNNMDLAALVYE